MFKSELITRAPFFGANDSLRGSADAKASNDYAKHLIIFSDFARFRVKNVAACTVSYDAT